MVAGNAIRCSYSDPDINRLLGAAGGSPGGSAAGGECGGFTRHYNQVEEFFLRLRGEFAVPRLPVHHDVRQMVPDAAYRGLLGEALDQIVRLAPEPFQELTHLFDPTDTLRPAFFTLYRIGDRQYLYLLRLDLLYRPQVHRALVKGGNDYTPAYSSDRLFLEALLVPLAEVIGQGESVQELRIDQTISNTWVDETGRGYLIQGIWIDNDLTRFFSKLFLPAGARLYPYYPFVCKYKTVCQTVIHFAPETRGRRLTLLHRALDFLRPAMAEIEASMKSGSFSEDNPVFKEMRTRVPESWHRVWEGLRLEAYLDDQDMKEFRIDESPA